MTTSDRQIISFLRDVALTKAIENCLIDPRHGSVRTGEPFCPACCEEIEREPETASITSSASSASR